MTIYFNIYIYIITLAVITVTSLNSPILSLVVIVPLTINVGMVVNAGDALYILN